MQQTINNSGDSTVDQLKRIAINFSGKPVFIPCYGKKEGGKKPPCKMGFPPKTPLRDKLQLATDLDKFSTMEILSLYLGDDFIVLDIDGKQAMDLFNDVLLRNLGKLPDSLYVTSDPVDNTRGAYFFKIPENYVGRIKHHSQVIGDSKLEFRTGDHYQAISGLHPISGYYHSPNLGDFNYSNISELPKDWCDYIVNAKAVSPEARKENNDQITNNKLVSLRGLLDLLDALECDSVSVNDYETWIKMGMIFHTIDSENGLEAWMDWSEQGDNVASDDVFTEKWNSFNSDSRRSICIGSVFYWLNQKINKSDQIPLVKKEEISQKIADARRIISPRVLAEDVIAFVKSLKEEGIYGEILSNAIENFTLEAFGSLNSLDHVWSKYHDLDSGVTQVEKDAYSQSLVDSILGKVDTSEINSIMGDCSIIQIVQAYFKDQDLEEHYPIALMSFLTCVASILPKGLSMNFNQDYCRPPIVFSLIIGKPSDGKNALMDVFRRPLEDVTLRQLEQHNEAIREWEKKEKQFKGFAKKEKENFLEVWKVKNQKNIAIDDVPMGFEDIHPKPDMPRTYTYTKFSIENVRYTAGNQKDSGFLVCPSEIKNTLSAQQRYANANPASMPDMSEYTVAWDGDSTLSGVMHDLNRPADRYQFSLLTTIQPKVFEGTFSSEDPDGFLSRCFFLHIENPIRHKHNEDPDNPDVQNISPLLWAFYQDIILKFQGISWENPMKMKFTVEAKKVYNHFMRWCDDQAESLEGQSEGFRPFLRRMPAKIASLLVVMNAIRYQDGLTEDLGRVDLNTTLEAIKYAQIIISYAQKVYKINLSVDYDVIDNVKLEIYQKVIDLLIRRKTELNLRILCQQKWRYEPRYIAAYYNGRKIKKTMLKDDFLKVIEELVALEWVQYDPKSTTIKINPDKLIEAQSQLKLDFSEVLV